MLFDWFRRTPNSASTSPLTTDPLNTDASLVCSLPVLTRAVYLEELHGLSILEGADRSAIAKLRVAFYHAGAYLFKRGTPVDQLSFVLQGSVLARPERGHAPEIVAGTPAARFPLCAAAQHVMDIYAQTDVWILNVPPELSPLSAPPDNLLALEPLLERFPRLQGDYVLADFVRAFNADALRWPAMPLVVHRLRSALKDDVDIVKAAQLMNLEPVLAAKVIEIANVPVFRARQPVTSCLQAINLLGVDMTLNLVTALCLKSLYKAQKPIVKQTAQRLWRQSVYLSALCSELVSKTSEVCADKALLAGLFGYIGSLPFLHFFDEYSNRRGYFPNLDDYPFHLPSALVAINGPVGLKLLSAWGFPEELARTPLYIDDWFYRDKEILLSLTDVVILANWHLQLTQSNNPDLPPLAALPAFSKLKNHSAALDAEVSLAVLSNAKEEIDSLCQLLM